METKDLQYREVTITLPEEARETVSSLLMDAGCLGLEEQQDRIIAYFEGSLPLPAVENVLYSAAAALKKGFGHDIPILFEQRSIRDQDWNAEWKKGFTALDIGERFTVLPPWELKKSGRTSLVIDPGMAFGTGHHETTRSCLALMEKHAALIAAGRMLDLGTGTGLLALAAVGLGCTRVTAVDTDPLAIEATHRNAQLNEVSSIDIRQGGIADLDDRYDVIAANLISGTLITLARDIASRLNRGGIAILSGILAGQEQDVIDALSKAGLVLEEQLNDGKWVSLAMRKTVHS